MITIVELCIRTVLERLIEDIEAVARTRRGEMREWNPVWRLSFKWVDLLLRGPISILLGRGMTWSWHGLSDLSRAVSMPRHVRVGREK
jgi:hypothetical protein